MNFCTHCDINYLSKGLAMYQSLKERCGKFTLYWLCNDDKTWEILIKLNHHDILPVKLSDLEASYTELRTAKNNSNYGNAYEQYMWSLTPMWIDEVLRGFVHKNEWLFYIDADVYLFDDPQKIIDKAGNRSICLHTHRFTPPYKDIDTGWYNVGLMGFKNDPVGRKISSKWLEWMRDPHNEYAKQYGTCGDQKYVECFFKETAESNIYVFDEDFLHGAPWCCNDIAGKDILMFHFSHFTRTDTGYSDNVKGEWRPTRHGNVKRIYDDYFEKIKEAEQLIA